MTSPPCFFFLNNTPEPQPQQTANLDELRKQLEEARAESKRIHAHYEKKLEKERKAMSKTEKRCEELARQNAELQKRLLALTEPLRPVDDPEPAATPAVPTTAPTATAERSARKGKSATESPLPPLPARPAVAAAAETSAGGSFVPDSPGHTRSVSDCTYQHRRRAGSVKMPSALSNFIVP